MHFDGMHVVRRCGLPLPPLSELNAMAVTSRIRRQCLAHRLADERDYQRDRCFPALDVRKWTSGGCGFSHARAVMLVIDVRADATMGYRLSKPTSMPRASLPSMAMSCGQLSPSVWSSKRCNVGRFSTSSQARVSGLAASMARPVLGTAFRDTPSRRRSNQPVQSLRPFAVTETVPWARGNKSPRTLFRVARAFAGGSRVEKGYWRSRSDSVCLSLSL